MKIVCLACRKRRKPHLRVCLANIERGAESGPHIWMRLKNGVFTEALAGLHPPGSKRMKRINCAHCGVDLTWRAKKMHRDKYWCWGCPSEPVRARIEKE